MSDMANAEQSEFWNGEVGQRWLTLESEIEAMNGSVSEYLLAEGRGAGRILEIGCGAGRLAIGLAKSGAQVVGVDISGPMLARARERSGTGANPAFLLADAQTADLPGPFDLVLSSFGVMFFDDPVAAFANIRRAVRPGGRLSFATFGAISANPWFSIPRAASVARMGPQPAAPEGAPGPLAFADRARVTGLLAAAGWSDPGAEARLFDFHHAGGPAAAAALAAKMGPAAFVLRTSGASPADIDATRARIAADFAGFAAADGLHLPVEINLFSAHNG
ncbi:MAG: methyltransferase domain-containing protein [Proteobacteria bacterium]|nr:methyltransferase domain-containing protein [Pseudomonadota bacterium]MBS0573038.1 methyltransferase domain-containing protein [Pseudomonadota bacterium]